ncbi:MAG: hypothetical protein ACI4XP_03250 [Acutalibacteraceae bacterium]
MTKEQAESLNLGITITDKSLIMIETALDTVNRKTTINFDMNNDDDLKKLPSRVKLFVIKYLELMNLREGVSSESITNLSQSFVTADKNSLLNGLLEELLGDDLVSSVRFVSAKNRWK